MNPFAVVVAESYLLCTLVDSSLETQETETAVEASLASVYTHFQSWKSS